MGWVSRFRIARAADALRRGRIVAYPTEAVYGLGCDPFNEDAVRHLLALKQRSETKGLILIAADVEAIEALVDLAGVPRSGEVRASWPGPTTWLIPPRLGVPEWLCGAHDSLAVRVTAHPIAAALCRAFGGAIVSTSANLSGHRPARTPLRLWCQFSRQAIHFLPGRLGGADRPTRILDAMSGRRVR
ncbi:L-threonylcarbamoyladenylate synthase [Methylococcus geothermalis]|uniref:Threonylcarbamoyl-AMP synthase n=1 Tax=Methylococcus geothermalis TaxID=2681310 RepID=A0A858Q5P1_9GAMM|nr:Sua5/YciO/YrdC/YwlC family protein [Methylococcus geothermalis]QJD29149.1 tRNA threonylcarbamoyladenosine biosynthesis protein RimN [Methylococcus geothermalis]